jgi:hypothetical protein
VLRTGQDSTSSGFGRGLRNFLSLEKSMWRAPVRSARARVIVVQCLTTTGTLEVQGVTGTRSATVRTYAVEAHLAQCATRSVGVHQRARCGRGRGERCDRTVRRCVSVF